uniref:Uncharacterized protein n=1 Tax=Nelumbo nucifera TaxID=4432 RepID=A0A822XH50_NELNU|nr:TPA_asm: hypothetical protein HUJ06_021173 [Nelumbo nucifera]
MLQKNAVETSSIGDNKKIQALQSSSTQLA